MTLVYVVCGVLMCGNLALSAVVWTLVRSQERMMRAMSVPYREASAQDGRKPTHYSMYQTKLPGDNE